LVVRLDGSSGLTLCRTRRVTFGSSPVREVAGDWLQV
jgi:hypothetical protein